MVAHPGALQLVNAVESSLPTNWSIRGAYVYTLRWLYRDKEGICIQLTYPHRLPNSYHAVYFVPREYDPMTATNTGCSVVVWPLIARTSKYQVYLSSQFATYGWSSSVQAIVSSLRKVEPDIEWTAMSDQDVEEFFRRRYRDTDKQDNLNVLWKEEMARLRPMCSRSN